MKSKLVMVILLVLIIFTGYMLFAPEKTGEKSREPTSASEPARPVQEPLVILGEAKLKTGKVPHGDEQTTVSTEEERRVGAMQAEYAELEKARHALRRQLGKLRARTWNLHLPVEQANTVRNHVQQGYAILKNPPMLGAFYNVADIRKETAKIEDISHKLKSVESIVLDHISRQEER